MNINPEIILNVFIAIVLYKVIRYSIYSAIEDVLYSYFLNTEMVQKSKNTFQEKLKEKMEENHDTIDEFSHL